MSDATTIDDVESSLYETGAAATRTRSSVKRNVTIFSLAADFWKVNRRLRHLTGLLLPIDLRPYAGVSCQHTEKLLTSLIRSLDSLIDVSEKKRLNNRTLIGPAFYDIKKGTEQLKDFWVAVSSSTDAELDETLAAIKDQAAESWESIWP